MTAPVPVAELLDRLEQLRAEATPGEWIAERFSNGAPGTVDVKGTAAASAENYVAVCWRSHADAALIVAAVNALPGLTAALRNVLVRMENLEISAPDSSYRTVAALLRSDFYAALVPGRDGQQR